MRTSSIGRSAGAFQTDNRAKSPTRETSHVAQSIGRVCNLVRFGRVGSNDLTASWMGRVVSARPPARPHGVNRRRL
jgi:hypothetical protein